MIKYFTKQFLRDDGGTTMYDRIVDHSRWSVIHEQVFEFEGHYYLTSYSVGATESQDESPYEYEKDEIPCTEVCPHERMTTVYEPCE